MYFPCNTGNSLHDRGYKKASQNFIKFNLTGFLDPRGKIVPGVGGGVNFPDVLVGVCH